ncbi:MAG: ParB/RepB/Spo0J family partition protein, partial [Candidatus Eisenbacteria sp.]|nr:ParB/RepB/Spo0J family partition protein [Candidatus Eisenbacteria bacterium]
MGPRSPTTELSAGPRGGETRPDQRAEGKDQPLEVLRHVPIESIVPNSQQPRTDWEPEGLKELARSISANGLLEPIIVRTVGDRYEIVAGERRWRACKIAGWLEI